jgi:hypothetical protein
MAVHCGGKAVELGELEHCTGKEIHSSSYIFSVILLYMNLLDKISRI